MSANFANWDERTLDLAIDRYTLGLDRSDEADLERLAEEADLRDFEHMLAAIHLAGLGELRTPSREFLGRLESAGRLQVGGAAGVPQPEPAPRGLPERPSPASAPRPLAWAGWLVAAALLATFWLVQPSRAPGPDQTPGVALDPNAQRAELLASAADLVRVDWTATEDPLAAGASGDVVWSPAEQRGFMRFERLTPNRPEESQYQLWIFDPTRADWEAKPVDGGVFDVPSDGEVVVPIDAKLHVRETALFAVTLEAPGGVVVSEREHLVLTAAL